MNDICTGTLIIICAIIFINTIANSGKRNKKKRNGSNKKDRPRSIFTKPPRYGKMIYIYKLRDNRKVFYIGQTVNPTRRLGEHISLDGSWTRKHEYINRMRKRGRKPKMEIIAKTRSKSKANRLERQYIQRWGSQNTLHR